MYNNIINKFYWRYAKNNEQQQNLIESTGAVNRKRGPDTEHEQLEEKETQLVNEQKN